MIYFILIFIFRCKFKSYKNGVRDCKSYGPYDLTYTVGLIERKLDNWRILEEFSFYGEKVIIHDKYIEYDLRHHNETVLNPYDIALIRLVRSVDFARVNGYYKVNSICLPQENDTQENEELAQLAGWGLIKSPYIDTQSLQMGYMNVMKASDDQNPIIGIMELNRTNSNSATMCSVSIFYKLLDMIILPCDKCFLTENFAQNSKLAKKP